MMPPQPSGPPPVMQGGRAWQPPPQAQSAREALQPNTQQFHAPNGMQQQMMSGTMMIRSDPGFRRVDFKSGEALGNCDGMAVAVGEGVGICEGAGEGVHI